MSNRIVLKANKQSDDRGLVECFSKGQILVGVCLRFIEVQDDFACLSKRNLKNTSSWHALEQEFHPAAMRWMSVLALWLLEVDAIH